MKGLYILIGSTFFVGFVTGVFIYFLGIGDEPIFPSTGDNAVERGFEIIGDEYGACVERGCVSLRIDDTGAYERQVFVRGAEGGEKETRMLSTRELTDLKSALRAAPLNTITANESESLACTGTQERYEIRVASERHFIDSCRHETGQHDLFRLLDRYFAES